MCTHQAAMAVVYGKTVGDTFVVENAKVGVFLAAANAYSKELVVFAVLTEGDVSARAIALGSHMRALQRKQVVRPASIAKEAALWQALVEALEADEEQFRKSGDAFERLEQSRSQWLLRTNVQTNAPTAEERLRDITEDLRDQLRRMDIDDFPGNYNTEVRDDMLSLLSYLVTYDFVRILQTREAGLTRMTLALRALEKLRAYADTRNAQTELTAEYVAFLGAWDTFEKRLNAMYAVTGRPRPVDARDVRLASKFITTYFTGSFLQYIKRNGLIEKFAGADYSDIPDVVALQVLLERFKTGIDDQYRERGTQYKWVGSKNRAQLVILEYLLDEVRQLAFFAE